MASAEAWLALVDSGKYADSWKQASDYFKNAVKQPQWEQSLAAVRKPLGKIVSRTLSSKTYITSLPGAPDGEYVVIQFETSFQNKKSAVETITVLAGPSSLLQFLPQLTRSVKGACPLCQMTKGTGPFVV